MKSNLENGLLYSTFSDLLPLKTLQNKCLVFTNSNINTLKVMLTVQGDNQPIGSSRVRCRADPS